MPFDQGCLFIGMYYKDITKKCVKIQIRHPNIDFNSKNMKNLNIQQGTH